MKPKKNYISTTMIILNHVDITPSAGFDGFMLVPHGNEHHLLQVVAQQSITFSVAPCIDFQNFKGNGMFEGSCANKTSHVVAIVGYGVSDDGRKYWIIKKFWGERWRDLDYAKPS